jgi:hypothetical protein
MKCKTLKNPGSSNVAALTIAASLAAAALAIVTAPPADAATVVQTGANGADGADGNPPTKGQDGGSTYASETGTDTVNTVTATGGNGGNGGNATGSTAGGKGGAGGGATVNAGAIVAIVTANGGNGGAQGTGNNSGLTGASGGNAMIRATSFGDLYIEPSSGGAGGAGTDGMNGGTGGTLSIFAQMFLQSSQVGTMSNVGTLLGGNGGDIYDGGPRNTAGQGGDVDLSLGSDVLDTSSVAMSINAAGGNGGNVYGSGYEAGAGGTPTARLNVSGGPISVTLNLSGGNGGNAEGAVGAGGGLGASVSFNSNGIGSTGPLYLVANLTAGNGGNGNAAFGGNGGGVDRFLSLAGSEVNYVAGGSSTGGNGGNDSTSGRAGAGGGVFDSFYVDGANAPVTTQIGEERGGNGGSGLSAPVCGVNGGNGGDVEVSTYAMGTSVYVSDYGIQGGNGGAAFPGSQGQVTSGNGGYVDVNTSAYGIGSAQIFLSAAGGSPGGPGATAGYCVMSGAAYSDSGGLVNVNQTGTTVDGADCYVQSFGSTTGNQTGDFTNGFLVARANTSMGFITLVSVRTTALPLYESDLENAISLVNIARHPQQPFMAGTNSYANVTGEPLPSDESAAIAPYPTVQAALTPTSQVIGLMTLSGTSAGNSYSPLDYHAETDWTLDTTQMIPGDVILLAGLLGATSTGDGTVQFQITDNGISLVNQTFNSFASADAYFDGQVLNLGPLIPPGATGTSPQIDFVLDVFTSEASAAFQTQILAAAVPEPRSCLLAASGGLVLLGRRRRKSCPG